LPLPVLAPSLPLLAVALFVLGAGNGALDVSMNAQAVAVEARFPRPIMSSFHGMWSLGGLAGAGTTALALGAGVRPVAHVLAATALLAATTAIACTRLVPPSADVRADEPRFARPTRAVVGLGTIAFLALLSEGAMGDWAPSTSSTRSVHGRRRLSRRLLLTIAAGPFLGERLVLFEDSVVIAATPAPAPRARRHALTWPSLR
jgi:hypothetical protein